MRVGIAVIAVLVACGSDPTSVPPEPHAPEIGFRRVEFTVRHPVDGTEKDVRYRASLWINDASEEQIVGNTLPIEAGALQPFAVNWDGTAYPVVYTRPAYAATVRLSARAESCTASVERTAAPGATYPASICAITTDPWPAPSTRSTQ